MKALGHHDDVFHSGEGEVAGRDGVRHVALRARPGDTLSDASMASSVFAGTAVVKGRDEQQTAE